MILHWFETTRQTSETIIEAAAASCVRQALAEAVCVLLEPMVKLEITTDAKYQSKIMDDLNRRRFQLEVVDQKHDQKVWSIYKSRSCRVMAPVINGSCFPLGCKWNSASGRIDGLLYRFKNIILRHGEFLYAI